MPKLRRMRLCGIGHDNARFDDVTLDFTDREDRPTNSVLWLRNGGGKTSLLSLFFAGVRPNKREFLGQRADEKIRRLGDYVGPQDHGVVVCEWELDTERSLFSDSAPRYLSGVLYQRKEADGTNGDVDVDRLFFATLVSAKEPELTLEGLPIFSDQASGKTRRTLSGLRRRLRQLDREQPDRNVFVEDKNQTNFEKELASRGIDPQVFFYQIRMNEREGGVTQLFSFASDEDFADFLLEMTFDQQHARQVREQLSTFRQEIVERNEQLKPELEYCQGLIARLHKLAGVAQERTDLFRQTALAQGVLQTLNDWVSNRRTSLQSQAARDRQLLRESEQAAESERQAAELAERLAAVHQRAACGLRLQEAQAEYDASERGRLKAKRQKEIGQAAVPLARVWDARREADRHRELLKQKLQEFAPELQHLTAAATSFANALEHDRVALRAVEKNHREEAQQCRQAAEQAQSEASAAGERAAQDEKQAGHLQAQLLKSQHEEQLMREQGVLAANDMSAAEGIRRLTEELEATAASLGQLEVTEVESQRQRLETFAAREQAQLKRTAIEKDRERAEDGWVRAQTRRNTLAADATLLRLLQTEQVDVEAAAIGAVTQASDELRRVTDTILRIGVEAAEDEKAIHGLTETELLPPTQDVQSLLDWFQHRNVTCWSGWEYLHRNVTLKERRSMVRRLPQIAAGVVVANSDYDRVVELFSTPDEGQGYRSRSPVVVAPADALRDGQEVLWVVVGPTSDAHFDKGAGAEELTRLLAEKSRRQQEISRCQEWREALTTLRHQLQQFQQDYPRGWFSDQRQKLDIIDSRLEEAQQLVSRLSSKHQSLEGEIEQARRQITAVTTARDQMVRSRDRLEQFERSYGSHSESWRKELAASREGAERARQQQSDFRQKAGHLEQKERQFLSQVNTVFIQAALLEVELAKVKHCDGARRQPTAGPTEELRIQYELLLADYEGKVHTDALSRLAEAKDQEAVREEREFQRVFAKLPHLNAEEVTAELRQLPEGMTAQQQLEQADTAFEEATRRLGPLANRRNSIRGEFDAAEKDCSQLSKSGPLPVLSQTDSVEGHLSRSAKARHERDEHTQLAAIYHAEIEEVSGRLTETGHEAEKLEKDQQRLTSVASNHERQFARLSAIGNETSSTLAASALVVKDSAALVLKLDELERSLNQIRDQQESLDARRDALAKDVSAWSRQERYGKLRSSISHRFLDRDVASLEAKAEFDIRQLNDYVFQIDAKLKEADQQREIVIHVLSTAVDEALSLLGRVSRMSKLPDSLPQAGKHFLKIETKASDNPTERRTYIGELIDELLERGDVGDGLQLVQKAVRRVARRISVRVLHPDLHQQADWISIAQTRGFSGGERLTSAILLYCSLIRLRQGESNRRGGSSVLILDNPIGTASRLSFLDMQREVAGAMNVQLIYATAVNDLNAVGALENIIRLRNTRSDGRTGRRFIEAEGNGGGTRGDIEAARVVFDTPPSSLIQPNGTGAAHPSENGAPHYSRGGESEVRDDARHS